MTISRDEESMVSNAITGKIICTAVVKLYHSSQREYLYQYTGYLSLTSQDQALKFILVDAQGLIQFDYSIINDCKYQRDLAHFHSFVGKVFYLVDQNCMVGLNFCNEGDASDFYQKYCSRSPFLRSVAPPIPTSRSRSSTVQSRPSSSQHVIPPQIPPAIHVSDHSIERKDSRKDSTSISNGIFGFGRKDTSKKEVKLDKSMISAPTDFQHVSHVGFNTESGFSVQNIPMEWKVIFQKAGITDEQLQDKQQIKVMKKFMKQNANLVSTPNNAEDSLERNQSNVVAQPQTRRAPPPPPPSRKTQPPKLGPPGSLLSEHRALNRTPPVMSEKVLIATPIVRSQPAIPDRNKPIAPARKKPSTPISDQPPIPNRNSAPPLRNAPSLPERITPVSSSGPPPPPPPGPLLSIPPQPAVFKQPNQISEPRPRAASGAQQDLLSAIRGGAQLKKTSNDDHTPKVESGDDLADALRQALQKRVTAVGGAGFSLLSRF